MFEVKERIATSEHLYSTMDFEEIQKYRLMGKLYELVDLYYSTKIDDGDFRLDTYTENGYRYAIIIDNESGEIIE